MDRFWTTGRTCILFAGAIAWLTSLVSSSATLAADVSVEKVLGDLRAPCAVAVRPGSGDPGEVFVAECGTGRVVKLAGNKPGESAEVITGFQRQAASDNKSDDKTGPPGIQSLYFLDHTRLVVAGAEDGGTPFVRLYEVADSNSTLKADDHKQNVDLPKDEEEADAIRSFHDLARTQPNDKVPDVLIAAATSEHGPAGLWKIAVRANTLGDIGQFNGSKSDDKRLVAGGVASAPGYIVIASGSKSDSQQADVLKFLNPADGHTVLQIKTELRRIVALAYSPATGNLFAADAASGGIYRLDDASELGKPACKSVKVADVSRPTSLGFAADGTLYVTALGDGNNRGMLLKLTGEL